MNAIYSVEAQVVYQFDKLISSSYLNFPLKTIRGNCRSLSTSSHAPPFPLPPRRLQRGGTLALAKRILSSPRQTGPFNLGAVHRTATRKPDK